MEMEILRTIKGTTLLERIRNTDTLRYLEVSDRTLSDEQE